MIGHSQAVLVTVNWNCTVEVRGIPGLNLIAIIQEPKGLVTGCSRLHLILIIMFDLAYHYYLACLLCWIILFEYDYELRLLSWLYDWLMDWILNIELWLLTIRLESWRRLAFWCQSCSGCSRIDLNRLYLSWYVLYSYCILLLGVSSRVLFDPQIKVKARLTNSELGDRGGLYMWASCMRIMMCCYVVWVLHFVVRRLMFMSYWLNMNFLTLLCLGF